MPSMSVSSSNSPDYGTEALFEEEADDNDDLFASVESTNFSQKTSILTRKNKLVKITLVVVCVLGALGIVGGKILGGMLIGAGSYLIFKQKATLLEKGIHFSIINVIGILTFVGKFSPAFTGGAILIANGIGYLINH